MKFHAWCARCVEHQAGGIKTARLDVEGKVFDVFDAFDAFDVDGPYGWDELPRRSQGGFFLLGDISGLCGLVPGPTRFTGPLDAATGTHREGNKA